MSTALLVKVFVACVFVCECGVVLLSCAVLCFFVDYHVCVFCFVYLFVWVCGCFLCFSCGVVLLCLGLVSCFLF